MEEAVFLVKQFSEEGRGIKCADTPQKLTSASTKFVTKHVMSELMELLATTEEDPVQALIDLIPEVDKPKETKHDFTTDLEIKAEQVDAAVDIMIYLMDTFGKNGYNLNPYVKAVAQTNLNKRFPDGIFHVDNGKILKPPGHKDADLTIIVKEAEEKGSWSKL